MKYLCATARIGAGVMAVLLALALGAIVAQADNLRDGDRALKSGHLEEAMRSYRTAASRGLAQGEAGVGRVWLRRGQLDQAMNAFRRAQALDPQLALAYYGQGEVLRRKDSCSTALPMLEQATRLDRRFPEARLALAECLASTGQFDAALKEFEQGLKSGRQWAPRFLVARGTAWMSRDSLRLAGIDFTRARELAPNDASVRRAIGEFYASRGTWALAIPEFQAAMVLDSSDSETRLALGQALFYAQRYDEALDTYRLLTSRDPEYAPGQLGLGDLLYRAGAADARRYAEAKAPLQDYTRLVPEDPRGWSLLGRDLYRLGERDSALAAMREAARLGETNRELYTLMGLAYADKHDWNEAVAAFEKGDPGPREYLTLAQIYDVIGEPSRADSIYRRYLAGDSTSAGAAFAFAQRGRLRFRGKDFAGAALQFERAVALDQRDGDAEFYRGLSYRELGRDSLAFAALKRAADIDSARADRYFWLGALSDRLKRFDEAEQAFQRCAELDTTGDLAGKACRQLGYYRLLKKRWTAAIPYLERATKLDAQDAQSWVWLGQAYQNSGNRQRASTCYRRVLALDPDNAPARQGLKSLAEIPIPAPESPERLPVTSGG